MTIKPGAGILKVHVEGIKLYLLLYFQETNAMETNAMTNMETNAITMWKLGKRD